MLKYGKHSVNLVFIRPNFAIKKVRGNLKEFGLIFFLKITRLINDSDVCCMLDVLFDVYSLFINE
ncbi:MAG: hypothetical protein H6Q13_1648 [Bacteroidetes bacterium]|nr:hypothetical protein [Bacteroidota bacterium]